MSALPTTEGAGIWGEARIHPAHLLPLLPVQSHPGLPSGDEERGEEMVGGSFFLPRGLLQRSLSADKGPASGSPFSGHPLSSLLTAACPAPSCSALRRTELKRGTFRSGRSLISCPLQTSELRAQEPWPPPLHSLGEFWGMGTISPSFRVDVLPGWPHLREEDYLPAISLPPAPGPSSLSLLLSSVQLLSSLTECLTVDPFSTGVWRQLYPKHLSQSRQVGVGGSPAPDPHREALIHASGVSLS